MRYVPVSTAAIVSAALMLMPVAATEAKPAAPPLPPYSGAYQPQGVDERGLWMEMDEAERSLRDSPAVIKDEKLNAYLHSVLCNVVGAERCAGVRIYVLRTPEVNADMAPNGQMRIWTGMLLRLRNEAELAAVLAHEFAHFEERHSLASFKAARSTGNFAMWMSVAGALAGVNTLSAQTSAYGSLYSFKRDQERIADLKSFQYLAASKYRPGASADIWKRMMDEADASALDRHQRSTRYDRTAFFNTHPTELERASYLQQLADKTGDTGETADEPFRAALATWRPQFLNDQLKRNDFGGSEYLLTQIGASGWTPDLLVARGELYRMRGNPRDLVTAAGFYREAISKGDADPLAHRGLGLALLRSGQLAEGRQALQDYLTLKPDCEDAAMLRSLVQP